MKQGDSDRAHPVLGLLWQPPSSSPPQFHRPGPVCECRRYQPSLKLNPHIRTCFILQLFDMYLLSNSLTLSLCFRPSQRDWCLGLWQCEYLLPSIPARLISTIITPFDVPDSMLKAGNGAIKPDKTLSLLVNWMKKRYFFFLFFSKQTTFCTSAQINTNNCFLDASFFSSLSLGWKKASAEGWLSIKHSNYNIYGALP